MASWVNFIKEIPLNEISENLKILLKKSERGVNFPKEIPLNEIFEKLKSLLKNVKGGQFSKEIPLNEISENPNILLKNPIWRIRYFCTFFSQNPDPHTEFNFPE